MYCCLQYCLCTYRAIGAQCIEQIPSIQEQLPSIEQHPPSIELWYEWTSIHGGALVRVSNRWHLIVAYVAPPKLRWGVTSTACVVSLPNTFTFRHRLSHQLVSELSLASCSQEIGFCHMRIGDGLNSRLQLSGLLAKLCKLALRRS
jgi:hypothetical protein